ncbi:MAG: BamA/TamA family outer membrane protein [Planctomycetota bacterium]
MPRLLAAVALLACLALPLAAQVGTLPFDPFRGMDPDGRIPKVDPPQDIQHAERWRYVPEARIKPGGIIERFMVTSFVSPVIFSEQDIGFGGGVALTDVDFRGQRFKEFANILLTYSEEGQQAYRINWSRWLNHREAKEGGIWREERSRLYGRLGYEKTLTRRFYGFGSRTRADDETSYTEELTGVGLGIRTSLPEAGSDFVARADLQFEHHGLSRGAVSRAPSTDDVFLPTFQDGDGVSQGWLLLSGGYDTRDSQAQPYEGSRLGASSNLAWGSGGEWGAIVGADAQQIVTMPALFHNGPRGREENPPTDVLAFGAFVQDTLGDLPFYSLPTLGGSHTLRGFIQNRFTDRAAAHATAEYRVNLIERGIAFTDTVRIERIGLGIFYDVGTVANGLQDLHDARWHDSYGFGFRLAFQREAVFRIEWGYGDEGVNFTLAFGNTF